MTEKATLLWIRSNLLSYISQALKPEFIYTDDWIAGMVMRETGILIMKYANRLPLNEIHPLMKGDYSKREGDMQPKYHGFGYMQIDVHSFPEFIISGNWQDPAKTFAKAIEVLEGKRKFLLSHFSFTDPEVLARAVTAAYNCGEGNVLKSLQEASDIDARTYNKDYSKEVWRFRKIYQTL